MRNSEGKGGEEITIEVREQQWGRCDRFMWDIAPHTGKD